jgi:putative hydrolase of the HAD superfamily
MTIRAVLWDFGGTITTSPFEAFNRLEAERGLPVDFLRGLNATNHHDNAWAKMERSEVGLDEFCTLYEAEALGAGHTIDAREVLACLGGDLRPDMVRALYAIKERGLVQAMLTNNFSPMDRGNGDPRTSLLDVFDVIVESSRVGVRKPQPEFYAIACEQAGVEPSEAVFLDDLGVNLKPARELGMTTIKVLDPSVALRELEDTLGFSVA